ncbi:Hypothetical predicted protein [Cloeon dipterum]|uniref:Ig-like domain-containing protein n=1 Tax=Cloeon dipterum TaxID=197152 RepID=A0A8S1CKL9_9INSE|nr:Hypothetical predicted protein [Cloeon dipterum]
MVTPQDSLQRTAAESVLPTGLCARPLHLSPAKTEVVKYVNETYIVACQSDKGANIAWTKPSGERVSQSRGRIHIEERWNVKGGVNLIFESIEKKDRGNYTCSAEVDGRELTQHFKLVVITPISFMDTPTLQNATEHQDMTIRCEVEGDPEPKVTWQVNGKHPQGPRHKVIADGLLIKNVSRSDRGEYLCRAFQASSIASNIAEQIITLKVQHKPHWPSEQSVRDRAYGYVSGTVNLSCEAMADPGPEFEWIKDSHRIGPHTKHAKLFREPNRSVLQLLITNQTVFGEYVCRASNPLGYLERIVVLHEGAQPAAPQMHVRAAMHDALVVELKETVEENIFRKSPPPLDVTSFRVQVKRKEDKDWLHANTFDFDAETGPMYTIQGLQPDSVYTIRAAAINAAGISNYVKEQNYRTKSLAVAASMNEETSAAPFSSVSSLCLLLGAFLLSQC